MLSRSMVVKVLAGAVLLATTQATETLRAGDAREVTEKVSGQIVATFLECNERGSEMWVKVTRVVKGPESFLNKTMHFTAQWVKREGQWVPDSKETTAFKKLHRGDTLAIEYYSDEHYRVRRIRLLERAEAGGEGVIAASKPTVKERPEENWKGRARIVGRLRNAPAAEITVLKGEDEVKSVRVKAGAKGYEIEWLEPGTYALRVEAKGCKALALPELELRANTDTLINIEFSKGSEGGAGDVAGFFGLVTGTVGETGEKGFTLKIGKVERVWKGNKAGRPKALEGETVHVVIDREYAGRRTESFLKTLKELAADDKVRVELKHIEGNRFAAIETLKKID